MSLKSVTTKTELQPTYFKCPIDADQSLGVIKSGRLSFDVSVQDASIDGFTALTDPDDAERLNVGTPVVFLYKGARLECQLEWLLQSPHGDVKLRLRRLRDLTEPEKIGSWWPSFSSNQSSGDTGQSTLAFAGFAIVLFLAMAMPGLGDKLGTSERISSAIKWIVSGVDEQIDKVW